MIAGASLDNSRISKADVIAYALKQLGNFPQPAVMVGDREHDIGGAQMNQLPAIGVLYGYGSAEEFEKAGADFIVATVEELEGLFLNG